MTKLISPKTNWVPSPLELKTAPVLLRLLLLLPQAVPLLQLQPLHHEASVMALMRKPKRYVVILNKFRVHLISLSSEHVGPHPWPSPWWGSLVPQTPTVLSFTSNTMFSIKRQGFGNPKIPGTTKFNAASCPFEVRTVCRL